MPIWAQVITPTLAAILGSLLGGVVAWYLNYRTINAREQERIRQQRITIADTLIAEITLIRERLHDIGSPTKPENPKRDYHKALYHSVQPTVGLFEPSTVRALLRFYQHIELIEAEADAYNQAVQYNAEMGNTPTFVMKDEAAHLRMWEGAIEQARDERFPVIENALAQEKARGP